MIFQQVVNYCYKSQHSFDLPACANEEAIVFL